MIITTVLMRNSTQMLGFFHGPFLLYSQLAAPEPYLSKILTS